MTFFEFLTFGFLKGVLLFAGIVAFFCCLQTLAHWCGFRAELKQMAPKIMTDSDNGYVTDLRYTLLGGVIMGLVLSVMLCTAAIRLENAAPDEVVYEKAKNGANISRGDFVLTTGLFSRDYMKVGVQTVTVEQVHAAGVTATVRVTYVVHEKNEAWLAAYFG